MDSETIAELFIRLDALHDACYSLGVCVSLFLGVVVALLLTGRK